jgi:hypothetical protein
MSRWSWVLWVLVAAAGVVFLTLVRREARVIGGTEREAPPSERPAEPAASIAPPAQGAREEAKPYADSARVGSEPATTAAAEAQRASVRVRFVGENGSPIPDVALAVLPERADVATSDSDGVALLELRAWNARAGAGPVRLALEARCAGFATDERTARATGGELLLGAWTLVAGGSVEGRVVDGDGLGLADVEVACLRADMSAADWAAGQRDSIDDLARPGARASSSAGGDFRLDDVPAGSIRLVAVAEERPAALSDTVVVPAGGLARDVTIRMEPVVGGTTIAGVVLDPDRRPIPGASVSIAGNRASHTFSTSEDGRFRMRMGHEKPCEVTARDPEQRYREAVLTGVRPGATDLVLVLAEAPSLVLKVRSRAGEPIERFALALKAARGDDVLASWPEAARAGGVAEAVAPGQGFLVEVRANGWRSARLGPFSPEAPPAELECTLDPAGGVSGTVTAAEQAVSGARVSLHESARTRITFNGFPLRSQPEPVQLGTSDPDGRFRLSVDARGSYFLRAEAAGFAPGEIGPLELSPDAEREERPTRGRLARGRARLDAAQRRARHHDLRAAHAGPLAGAAQRRGDRSPAGSHHREPPGRAADPGELPGARGRDHARGPLARGRSGS